jgi:hypothetical protein
VQHTAGGDNYLGRFLAFLSLLQDTFDLLPVHFHPSNANLSEEQWATLVPFYSTYPDEFRISVIPRLVAISIFHIVNGDVDKMFPVGHPYLKSVFYTQRHTWEGLVSLLATGQRGRCDGCPMEASGCPAMNTCLSRLREVNEKVTEGFARMSSEIGAFSDNMNSILSRLPGDTAEVSVATMRENFNVEGVAPVNMNDVRNLLLDHQSSMIRNFTEVISASSLAVLPGGQSSDAAVGCAPQVILKWWNGLPLPQLNSATIPTSLPVRSMFCIYLFGNQFESPPMLPLCVLSNKHVSNGINLSRAKLVFSMFQEAVRMSGAPDEVNWQTISEKGLSEVALRIFDEIFPSFVLTFSPNNHAKITTNTVADMIQKYFRDPAKKRAEIKADAFKWENPSTWDGFWDGASARIFAPVAPNAVSSSASMPPVRSVMRLTTTTLKRASTPMRARGSPSGHSSAMVEGFQPPQSSSSSSSSPH